MNPSDGPSSNVVPRDTSSIPGVSMFARQWYPATFFKHEEVVANRELFFEALNKFHTVLGTRLTKKGRKGKERAAEVKTFQESIAGIPPLGGVAIDLHLLYVEVTNRGGLEKVIKDRKWAEVTNVFKFPGAVTSGPYMLRKYYVGLLYYFEQAYCFGKQGPLVPPPRLWMPGPVKKSDFPAANEIYPLPDGVSAVQPVRKRKIVPLQLMPVQDPIGLVARGAVKGKFEQGYVVSVTVGTDTLHGVLYHLPPTQRIPQLANAPNYAETNGAEVSASPGEPKVGGFSWRKRPRKEEILKKDPNAPRPNRTGYNFFFAEQCSKFKSRDLSRTIGNAWNSLTEEEKLPYREQGVQDKLRYAKELEEYRNRLQYSFKEDASATTSAQGNVDQAQEPVVGGLDDNPTRTSACDTTSESGSDAITEGCIDDETSRENSNLQLMSEPSLGSG